MAGCAEHPFIANVCEALMHSDAENEIHKTGFSAILESTGPFMLTRAYQQYADKEQVSVLPHEFLFPLTKNNRTGKIDKEDSKNADKTDQAYAIHHHWGSWWQA
jgi:mannosyltransferase OCH1-like enzyme